MKKSTKKTSLVQVIHPNAAGIDIGCESHFVAVPPHACDHSVREFGSFTHELFQIADWLKQCNVDTVAMESTGVYWIPLYEILESRGFEVYLVNSQHVKNVPGRKTDVQDCLWLQQLHSFGLLRKSFRPKDTFLEIRAFMRQRAMLVEDASSFVQRMQKALTLMNVQINNVIRDITGVTGTRILEAIVRGERDPRILASYRDKSCKNPIEVFERSLQGNYRDEHVFALKQSMDLYEFYQEQIKLCEEQIEQRLLQMDGDVTDSKSGQRDEPFARRSNSSRAETKKMRKHEFRFDVESHIQRITGVDLTAIDGVGETAALIILSEVGTDMHQWRNSKHFASWLGLCPKNKISGGKVLHSRTRPGSQRVAWVLRMCATSLHRSKSALGAHLRRLKSRLGGPKATTAVAHKLAKMIYNMLKYGTEYVKGSQEAYEERFEKRRMNGLERAAKELGFKLVPA